MSMSESPKSFSFGDPRLSTRFWEKCRVEETCWVWTAALTESGYAKFWENGKVQQGHRISYTALRGPIPPDGVLDHICKRRACIFPGHLEIVTMEENTARGDSIMARNAAKQFCDKGHGLFGDNVYTPPSGPNRRMCRQCLRDGKQASYRRNPEPAKRRLDRFRNRRPAYNKNWKRDWKRRGRVPKPKSPSDR